MLRDLIRRWLGLPSAAQIAALQEENHFLRAALAEVGDDVRALRRLLSDDQK